MAQKSIYCMILSIWNLSKINQNDRNKKKCLLRTVGGECMVEFTGVMKCSVSWLGCYFAIVKTHQTSHLRSVYSVASKLQL